MTNQLLDHLQPIEARIDDDFDEHLVYAQTWVRQRSVSADGIGIPEMADMVADGIRSLGGTPEVVPTDGHPVVTGHLDEGAERTLLVYCLYDVQPVEGEEWMSPPFDAEVVDLPEFGPSVVGRGIMNSEGPLAGFISAMQSMKSVLGKLPVNLKFVIEGEEELGSPNLPSFIEANVDSLSADGTIFPFYSQDPTGRVLLYLGIKGMLFLELVARRGDWGGPTDRAIHGMNSGWFHSPTWALVQALATMIDHDQRRILIEGIYDAIRPPNDEDNELFARLGSDFDGDTHLTGNGVARFKHPLDGGDLLRTFLFEPSLNIDGLVSGHHEEGMKTILPHEAKAKIDIRLVPGMDPETTTQKLITHLEAAGFPQIEVNRVAGYPASKSSLYDLANSSMHFAYDHYGCDTEAWPLVSGAAPLYLFTDVLGTPLTMGGLGHGGRQHSPNEYATVEGMRAFEKSMAAFVLKFAGE